MIVLRRAFAALVDLCFVSTYLISMGFFVTRMEIIGRDSKLLDFLSASFVLLYFGLLDSRVCGSGTIGKRLCGLSVRMIRNRRALSIPPSVLRTIVKIGFPILLLKLGADVGFFIPLLGLALIGSGIFVVPVSVIVGGGYVGFHDKLFSSYVSPTGARYFHSLNSRTYAFWCIAPTVVISFVISGAIVGMANIKHSSIRDYGSAVSEVGQLTQQTLSGDGSEDVRRFVKDLTIGGNLEEFPTDYDESLAKVSPDLIKALRGKHGVGFVSVELSDRGYSQYLLRTALLQRIASFTVPSMVRQDDLPTFARVEFTLRSSLGVFQLIDGTRCILIVTKGSPDSKELAVGIVEPTQNHVMYLGINMVGFALPIRHLLAAYHGDPTSAGVSLTAASLKDGRSKGAL